jgi:SAM-dependent methyltransferase
MTQAAYDEFYNAEYRKLYVGKESASDDFFRREVAAGKKIITYLSGAGGGDILKRDSALVVEVGCGAGGILLPFRELGCRVLGLDPGEEYLAFGRSKYGLDLRGGTLDAAILPRKADLIIYNHVIEHILDPVEELIRARRCLAAGGAIYLAVPGIKWLHNSYRMDFLRLLQNAHVWHFTLTTLSNLCRKAGLHVTSGEERIRMIVEPGDASRQLENDFPAVIEYLNGVERERRKPGQRAVILLQALPFREKLARVAGILRIKPLLKRLVFNREPPKLKSRKPDERGSPRPKK